MNMRDLFRAWDRIIDKAWTHKDCVEQLRGELVDKLQQAFWAGYCPGSQDRLKKGAIRVPHYKPTLRECKRCHLAIGRDGENPPKSCGLGWKKEEL